jgi:hypothetical protein
VVGVVVVVGGGGGVTCCFFLSFLAPFFHSFVIFAVYIIVAVFSGDSKRGPRRAAGADVRAVLQKPPGLPGNAPCGKLCGPGCSSRHHKIPSGDSYSSSNPTDNQFTYI